VTAHAPVKPPLQVVAVCCGQGFPNGMAVTERLKLIGRGLTEQGAVFDVFHIGGSPFPNDAPAGVWEGVGFRYFPAATRREPRRARRWVANAAGLLSAAMEIRRRRRADGRVVVYSTLYGAENLVLAAAGAPLVVEITEWYPGRTERAFRLRFAASVGAVPISHGIERRVAEQMAGGRRPYPQLRVPILLDPRSVATSVPGPVFEEPYLLWTGAPHGEIRAHLEFLVDAMAAVRTRHPRCRLVLIGNFDEQFRAALVARAARTAGDASAVEVHGFVPRDRLAAPIARAAALLAPLPAGVRWECCFPTKLGDYLVSGRPVVSSAVGEVAAHFTDGVTAMLAPPGDAAAWSERIVRLLDNPGLAACIGAAGRDLAVREFDYRRHAAKLYAFLNDIAACSYASPVRAGREGGRAGEGDHHG